jgi:hypothetical protein
MATGGHFSLSLGVGKTATSISLFTEKVNSQVIPLVAQKLRSLRCGKPRISGLRIRAIV